jgi:hypothetical protein
MAGRDWYDKAEDFWHDLSGTEYLIPTETEQIYPVFLGFLEDVNLGYAPEASQNFWDLLDYFGWEHDQFDWDDFREWYDSQ